MPYPQFDRSQVRMLPLRERQNKQQIERDHIDPATPPGDLPEVAIGLVREAAERLRAARAAGKSRMLAFGAHSIKNGLGPVLIALLERGWLTHLATNGAGIIHDWEFAYQGRSSEDVRKYVDEGQFGNWEDTGFNINLALNVGAWRGMGYGESVGAWIEEGGGTLPQPAELAATIIANAAANPEQAAMAAELLTVMQRFDLAGGALEVPHPYRRFSVQAAAYRLGIPFTGHPMFGHDIIYNHPMNHGPSLGRCAERDFLTFADSVSRIDGGVYLSVGSAIMSPMVFEKSMSLSQNLAIQAGRHIDDHYIFVVDLQPSRWDWRQGEPPEDNPDYYLRFNKSFNRMGGTLRYLCADNRDFFLALAQELGEGP